MKRKFGNSNFYRIWKIQCDNLYLHCILKWDGPKNSDESGSQFINTYMFLTVLIKIRQLKLILECLRLYLRREKGTENKSQPMNLTR